MEKHWIKLFTTNDSIQAELIKQMLEEHEVHAVVMNKKDSSYQFGQVEVYVHASEEVFARSLLSETQEGGNE